MGRVRVRVKGQERTIRNIKRDLKRGMDKSAEQIADAGREKALEIINRNQAYFNYEVAKGFRIIDGGDTSTRSSIKLINEAPHAGALDAGVPASEYADGGPPVQALLPWVARKMRGWDLDTDSDGGGNGSVFDVGPDVPRSLTGRYDRDDVDEGDSVYIRDSEDRDFLEEIVEKNDDTFTTEDSFGNRTEWEYDQIISPMEEHPVLSSFGKPSTGDRVYWYDEDTDELLYGYVTGSFAYDGYNRAYDVVELNDDRTVHTSIPVTRFVDAENRPEYDESFVDPSMKEAVVNSSSDGVSEMVYLSSEVVVYNRHTGETRTGTVTGSPSGLDSDFTVELDNGEEFDVDNRVDWVIRHVEDFTEATETRQEELMLAHFDTVVAKTTYKDSNTTLNDRDIQDAREALRQMIFPSFKDREHLGRMIFEWEKFRHNSGRAHVGSESDGWRLQMFRKGTLGRDYDKTYTHEFGHAYTQPTDASYTFFQQDPIEYRFAKPWPKRKDQQYSHMYDSGLPDWNPYDDENAIHGYVESYMFRDVSNPSRVSYDSSGNIIEDNRDQLEPFGFHDWESDVEKLARMDAEGTSPGVEAAKDHIQELTPQQVLKPDDVKLNKGDFIAIREDGELRVLEYTGNDGSPTSFAITNDNEDDVPTQAIAFGFKEPWEDYGGSEGLYVGEDGTLYRSIEQGYDYVLSKDEAPEFVGMIDQRFYDPSMDEFPELTTPESEPQKRLQEAANMAWWYQVVFIANDGSPNKADSKEIVLSKGYSSTYAEEVMSTFSEAMTMRNPDREKLDELRMLARTYPYFIEAYLLTRKPVSSKAEKILKQEGFDV
ncbi:hypothetical protein HRTV-15_gp16 [Halorubrum virus HRTV-15]|nr:hypothetical protein HRTV-15_gp16 [Halorubrum virus HRTV-15]